MFEGWELLSSGYGKGIVLVLDFDAVGRREACFSDFISIFDAPLEIWAASQPRAGAGVAASAGAYLQYWTGGLREIGREICAILGFCAGGVFAAALAEQIAQWQAIPPVIVLLDPEVPTAATLRKQFDNAMTGLAAVTSEAELAWSGEAVARFGNAEDLSSLGARLTSLYRSASERAFTRIGLKLDRQADLVTSFGSLMSYLVAASDVRTAKGWASATAITSARPSCEPVGVARQVRTDTDHADLLRSAGVARLVSELLESRGQQQGIYKPIEVS